jgi:acyl-CoA reductase-like NAD-dependent aldehyde dehydrogenase
MMFSPEGPPALPSWIHGRAFLTLTPAFFEVRDALSGKPLRRTPLCGAEEAAEAVSAATEAAPEWATLMAVRRQELLQVWAAELERYDDHFARLIRQETGKEEADARLEVKNAVAALRSAKGNGRRDDAGRIIIIVGDEQEPLLSAARFIAPALRDGNVVILKPSPGAPAAAYALAELSARAGILPGVVNLVQGDETALKALLTHAAARDLRHSGREAALD